ncbi:MAG: endonuclease V, partial [Nanoarchaeota archaeon]|nr:endonuclease V [Nanoarchaeota archaeon]
PEFIAYREMPAMIEAYNLIEQEPDLLIVHGSGILHPRHCGIASHLGLALNIPTIGVTDFLPLGTIEKGNIIVDNIIAGFEIKTRDHANPIYASPGHHISTGSVLNIIPKTIKTPHKMPEPLHLAQKIARKKVKSLRQEKK